MNNVATIFFFVIVILYFFVNKNYLVRSINSQVVRSFNYYNSIFNYFIIYFLAIQFN